jgi:hypothetical protein
MFIGGTCIALIRQKERWIIVSESGILIAGAMSGLRLLMNRAGQKWVTSSLIMLSPSC